MRDDSSGGLAKTSTTPLSRDSYSLLDRVAEVAQWSQRGAEESIRALTYLDSAATMLVSDHVSGRIVDFLSHSCANIHRGAHRIAEEATEMYEHSRHRLASFLHAKYPSQVVFTHGATEGLNLAVWGWMKAHLNAGDTVAIAEDNHHSNIICWQMLAREYGINIEWIPLLPSGVLDYGAWLTIASGKPKAVALCQRSNVIGFVQPDLEQIVRDARALNAFLVVDGAQAPGYEPVDFDRMGVDFYAISAHKMGGLTGAGALICSERVCDLIEPMITGGGMAARVNRHGFQPLEGPAGLEAGTPSIAAIATWSNAIDALEEAGMANIEQHVRKLTNDAVSKLSQMDGVSVIGYVADSKIQVSTSLVSFVIDNMHPHDVSQLLDEAGVLVRAGNQCAMPLHAAMGCKGGSVRASFAGYSNDEDVDRLVFAANAIAQGKGLGSVC